MGSTAAGSGVTVLCIGSDGGWMGRIDALLAGAGYHTVRLTDLAAAMTAVDRLAPHAVLLDVSRCAGDWAEFCDRLRSESHTARLPVMLVAESDDDVRQAQRSHVAADDVADATMSGRTLLSRVAAMLRRCGEQSIEFKPEPPRRTIAA